ADEGASRSPRPHPAPPAARRAPAGRREMSATAPEDPESKAEPAQLKGAGRPTPNPLRAMEQERWRHATIVVTLVAALEFVLLAAAGIALLGNPLSGRFKAETASAAPGSH